MSRLTASSLVVTCLAVITLGVWLAEPPELPHQKKVSKPSPELKFEPKQEVTVEGNVSAFSITSEVTEAIPMNKLPLEPIEVDQDFWPKAERLTDEVNHGAKRKNTKTESR